MPEASSHLAPVVTLSMVLMFSLGYPSLTLSCPQPCACYFSTEVHCTFRSLTAVPSGIPKLVERINFGFNNIQSVRKEFFDGLQRLELLMLHGNDIQNLPDKVFKNLSSLQALKMSYNKMTAITGTTFQGLVNLQRLHLDHNKIVFIQPGAFYGMTSLALVHLEGNQLQQIHPNTFVTFSFLQHFKFSSIKHLYLADNSIHTLPAKMLSQLLQLDSIYLHDNPWSCDCRLQWLLNWGKEAGDVVKCKKDRSNPRGRVCPVCSDPKLLSKRELFTMSSSEMACAKPTIRSSLSKGGGDQWDADDGEDDWPEDHQKPLGRMSLNLTDQHGNQNNVLCQVHGLRSDGHRQFGRLSDQDIGVNVSCAVQLTCSMNQDSMEKLWKLIAYYSETPVKLKKTLVVSNGPPCFEYRQAADNSSYYYTDVRANITAVPSWLMQDDVNIQLDRKLTIANNVVLEFSLQLSQQISVLNATKEKTNWVLIKTNDRTKVVHVLVAGSMLQIKCQVIASERPSIRWVLPGGSQVTAPYTSEDNRVSVSNTGRLVVKAVEVHDSGLYRCAAAVREDSDTVTHRVVVQPAQVDKSQVGDKGVTVPFGDTISLPCAATSVPDAQLSWILPNSSVLVSPKVTKAGSVMANGTLVIAGGQDGNSGHYRCVAANRYGLDVLTVNVAVIKKLPGQNKVKKVRPSPKFYFKPGFQKEAEREEVGSGFEAPPFQSRGQVSYDSYTGRPFSRRRKLHADGAHHSPGRAHLRKKAVKRGRGMLAAEGRRRLDSHRRINVSNRKIDPRKWADILAKVRGKSAPKVAAAPAPGQSHPTTGPAPAVGEEATQPGSPDPIDDLDQEDSSGNGDPNFTADELIHVSTPTARLDVQTPQIQPDLVTSEEWSISTDAPAPASPSEPSSEDPEVLSTAPTPHPPVEERPSEATGMFINFNLTLGEVGIDGKQGFLHKLNRDEYIVKSWVAKSLDHPVRTILDTPAATGGKNATTSIRESLGAASNATATAVTPEASADANTTTSTAAPPSTTTAGTTAAPISTANQADNVGTTPVTVPTSSAGASTERPLGSNATTTTTTTTTTAANSNAQMPERRRLPLRRYGKRRRPGRRYRLHRFRQSLQPKAEKANETSTAAPAVKAAPTRKAKATTGDETVPKPTTAEYHKVSAGQRLTTEQPAKVQAGVKHKRPGKPPTSPSRPTLPGLNVSPTVQTPKAANPTHHLHLSKTLLIQSRYELRYGPKYAATTAPASPLIIKPTAKPPATPGSSHVPTSSTATSAVHGPVRPGQPKGAEDTSGKSSIVNLSPPLPITERPVTTRVPFTSNSATTYIVASTTASNIKGPRSTPAPSTVGKVPTTPVQQHNSVASTTASNIKGSKSTPAPSTVVKVPTTPVQQHYSVASTTANIKLPRSTPAPSTVVKVPITPVQQHNSAASTTASNIKGSRSTPAPSTVVKVPTTPVQQHNSATSIIASIIKVPRSTPASSTGLKVPTTTALGMRPQLPIPAGGNSGAQDHGVDVPGRIPPSPHGNTLASLPVAVVSKGSGKENIVPGKPPTIGTPANAPALLRHSTSTEGKPTPTPSPAGKPGGVTSEGETPSSPTKLSVGKKEREGDRVEAVKTPESNAVPQRIVPKHYTKGWQRLQGKQALPASNSTWMAKGGRVRLRTVPISTTDARRKSPKYVRVEMSQKYHTQTAMDSPSPSPSGESVVNSRQMYPHAFVPKMLQNTSKPRETYATPPATTLPPPVRTIPVVFNKPGNKMVTDPGSISRATKEVNHLPPLKVVQRSKVNRGNQKFSYMQIPVQFTNVKGSATTSKVTGGLVAAPTEATTPTPATTGEPFSNTSVNRRDYYSLDSSGVGKSSAGVTLPTPSFRATKIKPKILTSNSLTVSVKAEMDAYLPCEANGEPKPVITWSKISTGAVVTASSKSRRFEVLPSGTLGIHSAEVQDRGQYMCEAQNAHGMDRILVTLVVLAQQPRIVGARYREATSYLGEPFAADCRAQGMPGPQVAWILPGRGMLRAPGDAGRGVTLSANGTLAIRQTVFSDRGVYKCVAGNSVGADTVTVRLHVLALPPRILEQRSENISAAAGKGVHAHCTARAAPPANIRWVLSDGMQIRPSQFINGNLFVFPNGTLYVRSLSAREVGTYECLATNVVGIARRTVGIAIHRTPAVAKITPLSPQKVDIGYGSLLQLDCQAAGEPGPRVLWRLPSKVLVDSRYSYSKRIKVHDNGTLVILSVTEGDAGNYLCVARNGKGDDFKVLEVHVMMKPARIEHKQEGNHKVMSGKDLKVDCVASGLPDPEISWALPDGTMVNRAVRQSDDSGARTRRYTVFGNGTLYFNEVGLKDEGDYTCYAVNRIGKDEMKVKVKVLAEPPTFWDQSPALVDVAHGGSISIRCRAKGEPTPRIAWHSPANRLISPSSKYQLSSDSTLLIQKAQRADGGNYTCTASNTAGESARVVAVRVVIEAPSINGQRSTNTVVKETATRETRKLIDCQAEGVPTPRIMWVLHENIILTAPYYGDRIKVHRNGTLDIKSLKQSDGIQFVCIAHNEGGEARLTVQLEVRNDLEKPSFTHPLSAAVAVVTGNGVNLNCSTKGNPAPEVTWVLPNGRRLPSGQQLPRMFHRRDGTLHISGPTAAEAGTYRCIARNTLGSVERLVTLEISHKPEIRSGHTSLVKILPGESMRLDCLVSGGSPSPSPRLSWVLPGGTVLSKPQTLGRFSLLLNGSLSVREASVYDRGTYSCRVASELGTTLTSVAVIVISYPPRITSGPAPVTYARHGASVQLNCMALAIPRAEISWELPDRSRLTTTASQARLIGNKFLHPQGSLVLQNPTNRDTGFYKCTARNLLGSDSKTTYVHVY